MTSRTTHYCDGCGDEMPSSRLTPLFCMDRVRGPANTLSELLMDGGGSEQVFRPKRMGDVCGSCLEHITEGLQAAPREIDGAAVDRILESMGPGSPFGGNS